MSHSEYASGTVNAYSSSAESVVSEVSRLLAGDERASPRRRLSHAKCVTWYFQQRVPSPDCGLGAATLRALNMQIREASWESVPPR